MILKNIGIMFVGLHMVELFTGSDGGSWIRLKPVISATGTCSVSCVIEGGVIMNRYYQMRENIRNQDGEKVPQNLQGGYLVMNTIPFVEGDKAVKFLLALDPDATEEEIRFDKEKCEEISKGSAWELAYLVLLLQIMTAKEQKKLDSFVAERAAIDAKERKTLEDTMNREAVQEWIIEQAGKVSGLLAAQEIIRDRKMDLMRMAKEYSSYWRITPDEVERMAKDA